MPQKSKRKHKPEERHLRRFLILALAALITGTGLLFFTVTRCCSVIIDYDPLPLTSISATLGNGTIVALVSETAVAMQAPTATPEIRPLCYYQPNTRHDA